MAMSEAVARIVNHQINELVLRCIKGSETRDYYDIAIIGYGENAYSGWKGELEGRDFVKPSELKEHHIKRLLSKKKQELVKVLKLLKLKKYNGLKQMLLKVGQEYTMLSIKPSNYFKIG